MVSQPLRVIRRERGKGCHKKGKKILRLLTERRAEKKKRMMQNARAKKGESVSKSLLRSNEGRTCGIIRGLHGGNNGQELKEHRHKVLSIGSERRRKKKARQITICVDSRSADKEPGEQRVQWKGGDKGYSREGKKKKMGVMEFG